MSTATRERPSKVWRPLERRASVLRRRADGLMCRAEVLVAPFRAPMGEPTPYVAHDPVIRKRLWHSAVTGSVGSALILWGASQPSSPFSLKSASPAAWFFGLRGSQSVIIGFTPPPGSNFYLSLVSFYVGMALLMQAWIRLGRLAREHPGMPVRIFAIVMVAWTLPMLFVAPLLSRDAYSYVAQGEMMSYHISPYRYGPAILGINSNSYTILTDRLWWYTSSPYGPAFLGLAGVIQTLVRHSELGALVMFRVVALFGVALIGVFIPRLARSYGRDASAAFIFAVMNPIVLIHLIAGEHNDALMLGLLVAGLALARERHPVIGVILVALAGLVKVPALIGVVYIGWDWLGPGIDWRHRLKPLAKAGSIALVVMAGITQAVGLGLAKLVSAVGLGDLSHTLLTVTRSAGALAAGIIGVVLLWRSKGGASSLRAIGLTMLAVVVLGPVMQPWYLAWGVVLLAPVAEGRLRAALVWLALVVTLLGLGDAKYLVIELDQANPLIVALGSAALLAVLVVPLVPRVRKGIPIWRARRATAAETREEVPAGL